jgi:hypothetical protein
LGKSHYLLCIIGSKWIQGIQSRHANKQLRAYLIKPVVELLSNLNNNTKNNKHKWRLETNSNDSKAWKLLGF